MLEKKSERLLLVVFFRLVIFDLLVFLLLRVLPLPICRFAARLKESLSARRAVFFLPNTSLSSEPASCTRSLPNLTARGRTCCLTNGIAYFRMSGIATVDTPAANAPIPLPR